MTTSTKHILAITGTRAEFGVMLSLLEALRADRRFRLSVMATAGHLMPQLGSTWKEIEQQGFSLVSKVPMKLGDHSPSAIAQAGGQGVRDIARSLRRIQPDLVVLTGDRYETLAAAMAAFLCMIPIVHLHGGEMTIGAMDDSLRHAITKLSHVHFASTRAYGRRLRQLGEEKWRVHVVGAPSLDGLLNKPMLTADELSRRIGLDVSEPTVMVTYHPATLVDEPPGKTFDHIARALERRGINVIVTGPNADPGSGEILAAIRRFTRRYARVRHIPSLGHQAYLSALACMQAMIGNSSSGIIEAASFRLPVVDIGQREGGRVAPANVVNVPPTAAGIEKGLRKVLSAGFYSSLKRLKNPYGDGRSAPRMMKILTYLPPRAVLLAKRFVDYVVPEGCR